MIAARLTLALVILVPAVCGAQTNADVYTQSLRRTFVLGNRQTIRLLPVGKSPQNRAIPALAIGDFRSDPAGKLRVLVCAGQHGDEPSPVRAALRIAEKVSERPDLLSKCVFVIVPMANPDGLAAGRRTNTQGVDLNRDWVSRATAETRFVDELIKNWSPQVLFDLHEWPDHPNGPANTIESAGAVSGTPHRLSSRDAMRRFSLDSLAATGCRVSGLTLVSPGRGSNRSLFDRHYTSAGYAALMIETGPEMSAETKGLAYEAAVLGIVDKALTGRVDIAALAPSARRLSPQIAAVYFDPRAGRFPNAGDPFRAAGMVLTVYCLALFAGRRVPRPERLAWSRRYTRCEVPPGVPPDPNRSRTLIPLTARSWIHQRQRTRFSGFPATLEQVIPRLHSASGVSGFERSGNPEALAASAATYRRPAPSGSSV